MHRFDAQFLILRQFLFRLSSIKTKKREKDEEIPSFL